TDAAGGCRQCAAVRTARAAMIVPLHEPACAPLASLMFSRTTAELSVEQSAPLTMAVEGETDWVTAPQALLTGTVGGGGAGVVGIPPPPQAAASARQTAA